MAVIFYFSSQSDPLALVDPWANVVDFEGLIHAFDYFGLALLLQLAVPSEAHSLKEGSTKRLSQWIPAVIAFSYGITVTSHKDDPPILTTFTHPPRGRGE